MSNCRVTLCLAALVTLLGGCGGPAQPSGSASVATPRPVQPAPASQIAFVSQPVTLVVTNAIVSQSGGATYTFEVATDAGFASKVATKSAVPAGASGQTSVRLDTLTSGTYYWHARAEQAGTDGLFSSPSSFTIGPLITITAPGLVAPANGAATEGWPAFRVNNATRSAAVTSLVYRFEVATSTSFATILLSSTVPETPGQTSFLPAPRVAPPAQTLFWRVTAIDAFNNTSGPASAVQTFTAFNTPQSNLAVLQGQILWPGAQPPGTTGQARLGPNWDVGPKVSNGGISYLSPPLDALRTFALLDRGMAPDATITWQNGNGYPTVGVWYLDRLTFGFRFQYMAAINPATGQPSLNGWWELVDRTEGE